MAVDFNMAKRNKAAEAAEETNTGELQATEQEVTETAETATEEVAAEEQAEEAAAVVAEEAAVEEAVEEAAVEAVADEPAEEEFTHGHKVMAEQHFMNIMVPGVKYELYLRGKLLFDSATDTHQPQVSLNGVNVYGRTHSFQGLEIRKK